MEEDPVGSPKHCPPFVRHCEKETTEAVLGKITGIIPTWLQGELIRVGPGIQKIGKDEYKHVFDGLAILHKFTVKGGQAFYQNRILKSDAYKKNMEANRIVVSEFGTFAHADPCHGLFARLKTAFQTIKSMKSNSLNEQMTDNCCVNVGYHGDQLYAMTECHLVRRVNPSNLDILGEKTNISDYLAINSATAHPHVLEDGTIINVGNNYRHSKGPHYCFVKIPPSFNSDEPCFSNGKLIAEIPSRWKLHTGYFHSFGITSSGKLIFIEYPYCMNLLGMAASITGVLQKSYSEWMKWNPKEKTRFYVVSMENGKLHPVIYETSQLFSFHHINAFEEDGELIVDVAAYNDATWVSGMTRENFDKYGNSSIWKPCARRYVLPLNIESAKPGENLVKAETTATAQLRSKGKNVVDVTPHYFSNGILELPRINYAYNGKRYSYFYGLGDKEGAGTLELGMGIIEKIDTRTGEKTSWITDQPLRASEPIFVPDSTKIDSKEDDGVILSVLLPVDKPKTVFLLVLDARNMSEMGRVEFSAAGTVTETYHGQWAQFGSQIHAY